MALLILPRRFKHQPQYPLPLSRKILSLIPPRDFGAVCAFNLRSASLGRYYSFSSLPTVVLREGSRQRGDAVLSNASVYNQAQTDKPLLGFVNVAVTGGLFTGARKLVTWAGAGASHYLMLRGSDGLVELYWNGTLSCTSAVSIFDGAPHTLAIAGQPDDQRLYIDGVLAASGALPAASGTVGGSSPGGVGFSPAYSNFYTDPVLSVTTGGYFHNWNPELARSLSEDLWQVYEAPRQRVMVLSSDLDLVADALVQSGTLDSATVTQTHILTGGDTVQASFFGTFAIDQTRRAIGPLPPPPLRSDTEDIFNSKAFALFGALPGFVNEINAVARAMSLNSTNSTSSTPMLIGVGQKSLVVQVAKSYVPGQTVKIAYTTNPANWMLGDVLSYDATTGVLVVDVQYKQGSGTFTVWTISLAAPVFATVPPGTIMFFSQAAAPVGWVQITSGANMALRQVNDASGGATGGAVNFTDAFKSQPVTGWNSATTLTTDQIPAHVHSVPLKSWAMHAGHTGPWDTPLSDGSSTVTTNSAGGGGAHNHAFTGTAINLTVKYMNVLLAQKQ